MLSNVGEIFTAALCTGLAFAGAYTSASTPEGGQSTSTPPQSDNEREHIEAKYTDLIKNCINTIKEMKPTLEECQEKLKSMKEIVRDKMTSK